MNEHSCKKEQQVIAALRASSIDPEILGHVRGCSVCSEVMLVAHFLRKSTQLATDELSALPDAALIWGKAQAFARRKALRRATLPIRIAWTCAFVLAGVETVQLILEWHGLWPWTNLWPRQLWSLKWFWPSDASHTALLLTIAVSILSIGVSAGYMLREEIGSS
jgi:hypothetical protein